MRRAAGGPGLGGRLRSEAREHRIPARNSTPTVFWHPLTDVAIVAHGDDFTASGPEADLRALEAEMQSWYEVKTRGMLGPDPGDDKEINILNRKVV